MSLLQSLEKLTDALVQAMISELQANDSVDTGALAASIEYDVQQKGSTYELVRTMLQYGVYVDQGIGRRPGKMPPVKPLMQWIKQKNISVPRGLSVESFAFAIANNIKKQGTNPAPKPFVEPAIKKVLGTDMQNIISNGAEQDIINSINNTLQDIKVRA